MLTSLFKPSPAHAAGLRLLHSVSAVSRQEGLFAEGRIPDTISGRFEAMALFGGLAMLRLRQLSDAKPVTQSFVDMYFKHLEAGLRESGVGDLSVPKKMKAVAGAVYGRLAAYEAALQASDRAALADVLTRNVFAGASTDFAPDLAGYVMAVWDRLASASAVEMESLEAWPLWPA